MFQPRPFSSISDFFSKPPSVKWSAWISHVCPLAQESFAHQSVYSEHTQNSKILAKIYIKDILYTSIHDSGVAMRENVNVVLSRAKIPGLFDANIQYGGLFTVYD